jgi:hypothetical protein
MCGPRAGRTVGQLRCGLSYRGGRAPRRDLVQVPGAECQVPSARCQVPSAKCRVPGGWCQAPSARWLVQCAGSAPTGLVNLAHLPQKTLGEVELPSGRVPTTLPTSPQPVAWQALALAPPPPVHAGGLRVLVAANSFALRPLASRTNALPHSRTHALTHFISAPSPAPRPPPPPCRPASRRSSSGGCGAWGAPRRPAPAPSPSRRCARAR